MPLIDIATNTNTGPKVRQKLLEDVIGLAETHLGKSKDVTMARLSADDVFQFRGSAEPAAYVSVRAIGLPDVGARGALVASICALLDDVLDIPAARVFVVFDDVPRDRWAANGALL